MRMKVQANCVSGVLSVGIPRDVKTDMNLNRGDILDIVFIDGKLMGTKYDKSLLAHDTR